jgi:hypothetical protein
MKKFMFLITALILGGLSVSATNTNKPNQIDNSTAYRGYGNSFIFVENNIEFSIFPDGQFDFYMPSYGPNVYVSTPGISISFNSGYDYNPYLQYDEFGAIIQVEHVPVYYDYYGRVIQIGNVFINYNGFGYVNQIGGLYIYYNRYRNYSYYTGCINAFNPYYIYRPWHTYYRVPAYNHCVVYNRPYRQYYTPVRYNYYKPYTNNYRRTTAVASRRGNSVSRQSELATRPTAYNNIPRRDVGNVNPRSTTNNSIKPREGSQEVSPRTNNQVVTKPRNGSQEVSPRTSNQAITKPRNSTNTVKPRNSTPLDAPRSNSQIASKQRTQTKTQQVEKKSTERKPRSINNRTYSKESNNKQVASNTRSRG